MKKIIFGSLLLASLTFNFTSCEKEVINKPNSTNSETVESITKEAPKRGEIACSIKDRDGNEIATGTRCGTPTGECGRYSKCKAVTPRLQGQLPDGMSYEEFVEIWNDETRREELIALGYYEEDIR